MTAREEHYDRARQIAFSLPPSDFGSHRALEALAAVFRADAAELDALRAVAEAAELWRLGRGQNPTGTLLTRLEAYIQSDAGAWLRALDRAREAGR